MTNAVKNALSLLDHFSETNPEIGLSDLARRSGQDKATVYRLMNALRDSGLVEQGATSKLYRLGPSVLHLARVREATFPVLALAQPLLEGLTDRTGETSHFSLLTHMTLAVIASVESKKATRVSMRGSETLPFHATASGLAFLAFARPDVAAKGLALPMARFTDDTLTTAAALQDALALTRAQGFAVVDKAYEDDVYGIAAPIFGPTFGTERAAIGAIAVATPSHRMTADLRDLIIGAVRQAASDLTRSMGYAPGQS